MMMDATAARTYSACVIANEHPVKLYVAIVASDEALVARLRMFTAGKGRTVLT